MERRLVWLTPTWIALGGVLALTDWWLAALAWTWLWRLGGLTALVLALLALLLAGAVLRLSAVLQRTVFLPTWGLPAPGYWQGRCLC